MLPEVQVGETTAATHQCLL